MIRNAVLSSFKYNIWGKWEQVQENAKRQLKVMKSLSYEKRLKELSLVKQRQRGEKIVLYRYIYMYGKHRVHTPNDSVFQKVIKI